MQVLINPQHQVIADDWLLLSTETELTAEYLAQLAGKNLLVPSALWSVVHQALAGHANLGLYLESHELIEQLIEELKPALLQQPLIALHFASFTDGRHFTNARLLRERYQFNGEIRAIGDVAVDQLFYLQRCGFNSFTVQAADQTLALTQLNAHQPSYQAACDEHLPLYRRRLAL